MSLHRRALTIFFVGLLDSVLMVAGLPGAETGSSNKEPYTFNIVGADVPTVETGGLTTRWASTVSPTNAHPEYPRPQLVRERWQNLNGLWEYAIKPEDEKCPETFDGQILVPFPIESYLSRVKKRLDEHNTLWYRRRFSIPAEWRGQSVELNFGGVNWAARVFLNGREIGSHHGDYDSFSFDITAALHWGQQNELVVAVQNPVEGDHPRGKQSSKPEGVFYSASSGIWQTVWLEPVSPSHFTQLQLTPDLDGSAVKLNSMANTLSTDSVVEAVVYFNGKEVARGSGAVGIETTLKLQVVRPWSPSTPDLYDVTVTLREGSNTLDEVKSYFGLRNIQVSKDQQGVPRLFLNGQPLFEMGVMDQGFWPDGLYTAPSDEAIIADLQTVKRLGFNLVRKHVKVEPERWYYWADRLGLLVWQDMPSGNNASDEGRKDFQMELEMMLSQRVNHPCIVMWILFNEGWGQFDTDRLANWVKSADPTRLVDDASGWTDAKVGDVIDIHSYPEPALLSFEGTRAGVLGEFGGLGLAVPGHTWSSQIWGYQLFDNSQDLLVRYCDILNNIWKLREHSGLAAAVYTQLTDVESECNGLLTYDRAVLKVDQAKVYDINCHQPVEIGETVLLPNAVQGSYTWRYTTNTPPKQWLQPTFDDSSWAKGIGGFGSYGTLGAIVKTEWKSDDIWLRREFTLSGSPDHPLSLMIHHDEDAEVYLNGVQAAFLPGYTIEYVKEGVALKAQSVLRSGKNVIAVHCHQTIGGQYIDVGIVEQAVLP